MSRFTLTITDGLTILTSKDSFDRHEFEELRRVVDAWDKDHIIVIPDCEVVRATVELEIELPVRDRDGEVRHERLAWGDPTGLPPNR